MTDLRDHKLYMLYVSDVVSQNANVVLVLVEATMDRDRYATFSNEVLNFSFWARDWQQVLVVIESIAQNLYNGMDIANPVEYALAVGSMLPDGTRVNNSMPKKALH